MGRKRYVSWLDIYKFLFFFWFWVNWCCLMRVFPQRFFFKQYAAPSTTRFGSKNACDIMYHSVFLQKGLSFMELGLNVRMVLNLNHILLFENRKNLNWQQTCWVLYVSLRNTSWIDSRPTSVDFKYKWSSLICLLRCKM